MVEVLSSKKCECCNQKLKYVMTNQKFCSACSLYHAQKMRKISNLKRKIERLEHEKKQNQENKL